MITCLCVESSESDHCLKTICMITCLCVEFSESDHCLKTKLKLYLHDYMFMCRVFRE